MTALMSPPSPTGAKTRAAILSVVMLLWGPGCTLFNINLGPRLAPFQETVISGEGPNKVLLLDIDGVIADGKKRTLAGIPELGMVEKIREMLLRAEKDEELKAVWLRINSPGGTVTSSDMIYHDLKVFKNKKKARVYVSFMDLAASGGYYIAMAGDKIVAHPTSLTGSIGVIALKVNLQGLLEKVGVDFEVVKSGDKKDFLSPLRPFTEEERKMFQETIDNFHRRFVDVIAENRPGLDRETVQKLADGRVFTAQQALEAKLVDRIAYLDETADFIKNDLGVPNVKVVAYQRPGDYKTNLYSSMPQAPAINLVNIDLDFLPQTSAPYFMYLWMP